MDRVLIERMCAGEELQVEGADTEKASEEKLPVIPAVLLRRFVLEERKVAGMGGARPPNAFVILWALENASSD